MRAGVSCGCEEAPRCFRAYGIRHRDEHVFDTLVHMGLQGCHIVDITDRSRRGVILGANDSHWTTLRVRWDDGTVQNVESDSNRSRWRCCFATRNGSSERPIEPTS
jgi:hypothetical protein